MEGKGDERKGNLREEGREWLDTEMRRISGERNREWRMKYKNEEMGEETGAGGRKREGR